MIDFAHVWLPQIVQYAKLISTGQLENEWLGRATASTSVTDPDELHVQVFDDLDADNIWAENRGDSGLPAAANAAIDHFLTALRNMDEPDAQSLVRSAAWASAKEAAQAVATSVR